MAPAGCASRLRKCRVPANLTDRHVFSPYGLDGGASGVLGEIILNPGSETERRLHSKESVRLAYGDVVSFRCSGSGGSGKPRDRSSERVAHDVREGVVTPQAARRDYGFQTRS